MKSRDRLRRSTPQLLSGMFFSPNQPSRVPRGLASISWAGGRWGDRASTLAAQVVGAIERTLVFKAARLRLVIAGRGRKSNLLLPPPWADGDDEKSLDGPQSLRLIGLELDSGKELFNREIFKQDSDAPQPHKKNSHASPTAIYDGERLLLHYGHQGTAAVDLDGNTLWSNRDHTFPTNPRQWRFADYRRGQFDCDLRWRRRTVHAGLESQERQGSLAITARNRSRSKVFILDSSYFTIAGRPQIISPGSNVVQSLDPETGKVLWFVNYDGYSVIPKPVLHQGLIFICTGYGPTTLYAIDPTGNGDVNKSHVKWTLKSQNVPKTPSLIAYREVVVMCSDRGIAVGVEVKTGKELWKVRLGGKLLGITASQRQSNLFPK